MCFFTGDGYSFGDALIAVGEFNGNPLLPASDRLFAARFAAPEPFSSGNLAELVALVDGLWGTMLFMDVYMGIPSSTAIYNSLLANAEAVTRAIDDLDEDALVTDPDALSVVAATLLEPFFPANYDLHYSFATKFLHWLAGGEHFPIMDDRARVGIRAFLEACGIPPASYGVYASPQKPRGADYARWIGFYSSLIGGLSAAQTAELLAAGSDPTTGMEYSLLRCLDKVFYIWGGGEG